MAAGGKPPLPGRSGKPGKPKGPSKSSASKKPGPPLPGRRRSNEATGLPESPGGPPGGGGPKRSGRPLPGRQPPGGGSGGVASSAGKQAAKQGAKQAISEGVQGAVKGAVKGAEKGAQFGAKIGSVAPGVGTAIGGVAGGAAGGAAGAGVYGAAGAAKGGAKGSLKGASQGAKQGAKNKLNSPKRPLSPKGMVEDSETADDGQSSPDLDGTAGADLAKGAAIEGVKGAAKGFITGGVAGSITGMAGGAVSGVAKKRGGIVAALVVPSMAVGVVFFLFMAALSSVGGGEEAVAQDATYAAVRDELPPMAATIYMQYEAGSGIPWELVGAVAHNQTMHGTSAPDGEPRAWPQDTYSEQMILEVNRLPDGHPNSGASTASAASTEDGGEDGGEGGGEGGGTIFPVTEPGIVDDNWHGIFLVDEEAWTSTGRVIGDAQRPDIAADFITQELRFLYDDLPKVGGLSFEGDRDVWVEAILSLPVKGLSGDEANQRVAEQIYETALAWMNGEQMCSASMTGLGGAALPTAGPVQVGDVLKYRGHGVVFTEDAWQYSVIVAQVAASLGLSDRAIVVALATIIVESNFVNMEGGDRDSVGLYQQRPSMGWGTIAEIMDPTYSTRAFFGGPSGPNHPSPRGLIDITNWETMEGGAAAQTVQASGHPDRYTMALEDAVGIVATLNANGYGQGSGSPAAPPADPTPADPDNPDSDVAPLPSAPGGAPTKALLVGDSLTVGASDSGTLPSGWTVDAQVGRNISEGVEIIEAADLSDHDALIVALGANDTGLDEQAVTDLIARVMTKAGATTPVTWVNVDTGSTGLVGAADGVNPALVAAAGSYPNFQVADWNAKAATIEGFDEMRAADGVHYNADGYRQYGQFIASAATGLANPNGMCGSAAGSAGVVIDINTGLPIELCPIQNATTNCQIVNELTAMIAAAGSQGTTLTVGNSYRSSDQQIELRKKHCGTSHFAIYEMSASSCSPPTARPGTSRHERGLAIDFANCSTRSTGCYQWLAANAESFGFYNLPSEAWHWSVDGG